MSEIVAEIKGLKKAFKSNQVLDGVDLTIHKGDVVAIIGPSGTGKSTLLRCINFLEKPDAGTVSVGGITVDGSHIDKKATLQLRKKTAMVFQQFNLFSRKTVLENVMEGLVTVKKLPKAEAKEIALRQLERVGMSDRLLHYPQHLSGGQQQRVAIARAMAMEPQLLLLDEPTSALDPELVGEVLETIRAAAEAGNTMLLVSHEMDFVRKVSSRVILLDKGVIVEDGTPEEVFTRPKNQRTRDFLSKMYLQSQPDYSI